MVHSAQGSGIFYKIYQQLLDIGLINDWIYI